MFIDLLTDDTFKRSVNTLCFNKIDLYSVKAEDLSIGLEGHLVQAVNDFFIEEITTNKKVSFKPEKILGNFLIYSNYTVSVLKKKDLELTLKFGAYTENPLKAPSIALFNKLEYGSIWWLLPLGFKL
jgi:hypothetical protein